MSLIVLDNKQTALMTSRSIVQAFAAEALKLPQVDCPVFHHFDIPGLYVRELHIPAGTWTTGKIHKYPCLNYLHKGVRLTLINDRMVEIHAPHLHWTGPGHQRLSYTYEDAIWVTYHETTETDVEKLERDLVAETEEDYRAFIKLLEMEAPRCLS